MSSRSSARRARARWQSDLCYSELAEARLREWAPREKPSADLLTEHHYYLEPLLPPATFLAEGACTAPESLLRLRGVRSVLHAAGRHLGGTDELTERRWEHLADGQVLTQLGAVLVHNVIRPRGFPKEEELALTRLCLPGGSKSWLAPGTRRWAALRALAQIHAQRPDESEQACIRRCCRGDAWLAAPAGSLFKDCIPGVFLQKMLVVLGDPFFTPSDLRVDHHLLDPGGAREADLPALRADGEPFCTVHPCAHWVRSAEVRGPACPLCGEPAAFTLKIDAGGALRARQLGGVGSERRERARDAWLERLPAAQQQGDGLASVQASLARCTGDAGLAAPEALA